MYIQLYMFGTVTIYDRYNFIEIVITLIYNENLFNYVIILDANGV